MRNYEVLRKGDQINTLDGYLTITGSNGSGIIWFTRTREDEDGNEETTEETATLYDLQCEAKDFDGKNHKYIYEAN